MLNALLLATLLATAPDAPPLQVMKSPAFDRLLHDVRVRCPGSQVRYASPSALLDTEDSFVEQLPPRDARRLEATSPLAPDGGPAACAHSEGGASCPAGAALEGIARARLEPRFARFVCARGDAPWY